MTDNGCPELEQLFEQVAEGRGPLLEHARGCESCSQILEQHRQLEKDLYRIADPLPPANFVNQVMVRVTAHHAPMRHNIVSALAIMAASIGAGIFAFVRSGYGLAEVGTSTASSFMAAKSLWLGLTTAVSALWSSAAVPLTLSMFAVLMLCLYGLKRLTGDAHAFKEAKVS
jgi:predicted anti-sigma-YlaC factor YlaD